MRKQRGKSANHPKTIHRKYEPRKIEKRVLEALQESEEKYRKLVDGSPNLIGILQDGRLRYVNSTAIENLGWSREELLSPSFDALKAVIAERDRPLVIANMGKRLRGENIPPYEINLKRRDGREIPVILRATAVKYEGRPAIEFSFADIAERKRVEEKLRESEERYRSLFDRMLDGIYLSTHEGRFVNVNPAFVKMFGYSSKQEMLDIEDIKKTLYFSPEERGSHILDADQEEVKLYRMRRKDGSEIWVEDHGHYIHDKLGNIIYHEGILRDVTERIRAQEALRENEDKYKTIFQNSPLGIFRSTFEGRLLEVNPALVRMFGYDSSEAMVDQIHDVAEQMYAHPEDRGGIVANQLSSSDITQHLNHYRRRDGGEFTATLYVKTVRDAEGRPIFLEGIVEDITERKRIEEELRKSTQFLETIIQSADVWLDVIDVGGNVLIWNKAAEAISGYSRAEVIGHTKIWEWLYPDEDYRKRIMGLIPTPQQEVETSIRRKNGETRILSWNERGLFGSDGKISGSIVIGQDVTERKQLENRLSALHDHALKLGSAKELKEVVRHTLDAMQFTLGFDSAEFWLVDEARERILREGARGIASNVSEFRLDGPGVTVKAVNTRRTVRVADSNKEEAYVDDKGRDGKDKRPVKLSELAVPVLIDNKVVALLDAEKIPADAFTVEDQNLLEILAFHVGSVFKRMKYEEKLMALDKHAFQLSAATSINEITKYTLDAMQFGLALDYVDVRIVEEGWLRCKGARGMEMINADLRLDGSGVTVRAANSKKTLRVPDTRKEPCYVDRMGTDWKGPPTMLSELAVPVIVGRETAAVLNMESTQLDAISDDDQTLLETLAAHVASAITRLKHEDELRGYSDHLEGMVKERSKNLAESETRYRRLFENSPVALFEEDFSEVKKHFNDLRSKGVEDLRKYFTENPEDVAKCAAMAKILNVNETTLKLYGAKSVGDLVGGLDRVVPYSFHETLREELVTLSEGKTRFASEFDNQTLKGDTRRVSLLLNVVPGYEDTLARVMVAVIDLTERKKMEERLQQAQRLAAIGETAAMVGHDLRNPLQGIAGGLHLLKQEPLTANERSEILQIIEKSLEYADSIVTDLADYSARIQLSLSHTTPKSIIGEAMQAVKIPPTVEVHNSCEDRPTFRCDAGRLRRVFVNLISNAIDAMPQGGKLRITSRHVDGTVEMVVSDTGSGIDEKVAANLWKPFQTTKAKGLGLGLSISKRIVDAHGGEISVVSKTGEGTTITTSLPINPETGR